MTTSNRPQISTSLTDVTLAIVPLFSASGTLAGAVAVRQGYRHLPIPLCSLTTQGEERMYRLEPKN